MEKLDWIIKIWNWIKNNDFLTLLLLGITAIAAYKSSRSSSEANLIRLLPIITLTFKNEFQTNDKKPAFIIENLGEGIAYDIEMGDYNLLFEDANSNLRLKLFLPEINILKKNDSKNLIAKTYENGKEKDLQGVLSFFLAPRVEDSIKTGDKVQGSFIIKYKNALGKRYYTHIIAKRSGIKIYKPARKLGFFKKYLDRIT